MSSEPAGQPAQTDQAAPADQEFERTPVPPSHQREPTAFAGLYAGEHVAGTEFMIGPLFVTFGVSAFDVVVGLLVGNLLAVLSWRFLCAPIATRVRLTLYAQLEKICGGKLVVLYNLANGVMFCFLAGSMITVSATAVGVPFGVPMPALDAWLPTGPAWIVAVLACGAAFALIAAKGYRALSRFADRSAPWMVMVFLACGFAALPQLGVTGLDNLWATLQTKVWTGVPLAGQPKFGFGHMVFFAWFCNLAMHIGMADLSILRFARRPSAGWASACGMYLGHYLAWIAAGFLYAVQLARDPSNTTVAPGPMAFGVVGWAGIVCVILAGWTTANPTIYRAGLALQTLFPKWSRVRVTLLAGGIASAAALFPALAMKLLGFIALYGLVLMPMGAIIFVDFWLFPRLGLRSFYAEATGRSFNPAAAVAWLATVTACVGLALSGGVEIYFVAAPGWFLAAILYVAGSKLLQRGASPTATTASVAA